MKHAIMSDFTRVFCTHVLPSFVNLNDKSAVLSFILTCYKYFFYIFALQSQPLGLIFITMQGQHEGSQGGGKFCNIDVIRDF